ncbi:MAG TPA: diaminopimelate epimerase [Pseudonocardia sp.]|nr:diaminopimelate epimerase [Pseudonocardia sp.]
MADPEAGVAFAKGHGTQNDFVLLPDPDGALALASGRVRALCDRRAGVGGDGVIRVVRTEALNDPATDVCADAEWFMDYRNADGSLAEMCGNGVRVFARYLVELGLVEPAELRSGIVVGTRGGPKRTWSHSDGSISVEMGRVIVGGGSWATLGETRFTGLSVDVGNPHLACVTEHDLGGLDLSGQPTYDPAVFPDGVNIEFVTQPRDDEVQMRVHERGVGETRSCGTGTVAAAVAVLNRAGRDSGQLGVSVPGGRVSVSLDAGAAVLTGPAVVLARGELDAGWWHSLAEPA